jgi:hypothetical protein
MTNDHPQPSMADDRVIRAVISSEHHVIVMEG